MTDFRAPTIAPRGPAPMAGPGDGDRHAHHTKKDPTPNVPILPSPHERNGPR